MDDDDKPQAADPFLASLKASETEGEADPWRAQVIAQLYGYHYLEPKTAFCALSTMVLAGQIGIAAPMWALKLVEKAVTDFIKGEGDSLDYAFGFKAKGTGKTAEIEQRFRKLLYERLCWRVHTLVVAGTSKTEAYRQVAQQVQALGKLDGKINTFPWHDNKFCIRPIKADTLKDYYEEFEKHLRRIDEILQEVSPQKDMENLEHLVNRFIDVARCSVANPSQQLDAMDESTTAAMKKFLDCLKPGPPSQS